MSIRSYVHKNLTKSCYNLLILLCAVIFNTTYSMSMITISYCECEKLDKKLSDTHQDIMYNVIKTFMKGCSIKLLFFLRFINRSKFQILF